MFAGLSAIASAVSRKVWIEQGIFTYYPNLYTVLVGDPGGGKSTALDICKGFVRSLKGVPIAADAMTVQALLREMSEDDSPCKKSFKYEGVIEEYAPMNIYAGELVNFMGMDPYGWVTFLTTVFHEKVHEVKTKNKGNDLLKGPFINMLGCFTPDITANMLQQRIISSGFARRCIFIWGDGRGEPNPFPTISPEQNEAILRCRAHAEKLQKVCGRFTWTQAAIDWYGPWYINLRKVETPAKRTPWTAGYYETKHVHLMKIAMLMSLSGNLDLTIDVCHFKLALTWLEMTEPHLNKVFEGSGRNPQSAVAAGVLNFLTAANEPVSLKRLKGMILRDSPVDEQDKLLTFLQSTDKIVSFEFYEQVDGRQTYRGTYITTPAIYEVFSANQKGARASSQPST